MQDELLRVTTLLLKNLYNENFISLFVDHACDVSFSDLACLYLRTHGKTPDGAAHLAYLRGNCHVTKQLQAQSGLVAFLHESGEAVVLSGPGDAYFPEVLLCPEMQSGMALSLGRDSRQFGVIILNSHLQGHYTLGRFEFLTALTTLAGVMYSHRLDAGDSKKQGEES
jgi:hypothetical protein